MQNVYSALKIFHFKEKIDSLSPENQAILPPVHVRIKPTNICNHHCHYCAYRADGLQLGRDMGRQDSIPREKMLEVMDDVICMNVKAVTFSGGGEPLIYPYMAETLKRLIQSTVKFAALSNGSQLAGELAELFAWHGTWIRISMDGWDDASYTQYRSVTKGEFTKIIDNMANFKKMGGPCKLGVSFIVDDNNASHVYEMVCKLRDIGVDSVKVSPCIVYNEGAKNNSFHRPFYKKVKDQIGRARSDTENADFEIFDAYHELDEKFDKDYDWCPYCQILPVIGADQNIYPCQDKAYNLMEGLLGSIRTQSFKDFWFSDKNVFFKVNPQDHCRHHCVANGKNKLILDYYSVDLKHLAFV